MKMFQIVYRALDYNGRLIKEESTEYPNINVALKEAKWECNYSKNDVVISKRIAKIYVPIMTLHYVKGAHDLTDDELDSITDPEFRDK